MELTYTETIATKRQALRLMLEGRVPEYIALLASVPRTIISRMPMDVPNPLKEIPAQQ